MQHQQSKELGELVSHTYKYTCKHTPYGCLNKIMLKEGDLGQQRGIYMLQHVAICCQVRIGTFLCQVVYT